MQLAKIALIVVVCISIADGSLSQPIGILGYAKIGLLIAALGLALRVPKRAS